ncbi:MAG: hypothetical protein V4754_11640 [Pseudomonadota bacterium]
MLNLGGVSQSPFGGQITIPLFPSRPDGGGAPENTPSNDEPVGDMNREKAMDILSKHEGELDSASSHDGKKDQNFNLRDVQNVANSKTASAELKSAAKFVAGDKELMRDIDGELTHENASKEAAEYSDGNFSWKELKKAAGHVKDALYKFTGYDDKLKLKDQEVDARSAQNKEGNCFMMAATKSVSNSEEGKEIIKQSIKPYDDGTYGVTFAGDINKKEYIVRPDIKFGGGDREMNVINAAADKYYKDHGRPEGITSGGLNKDATQLLTGKKAELVNQLDSKEDIEKKLAELAPNLGKDRTATLTGRVEKNGDMQFDAGSGTAHGVSISEINTKTGMVTYQNPWDTSIDRTISISDLSEQLSEKKPLLDGKGKSALETTAL